MKPMKKRRKKMREIFVVKTNEADVFVSYSSMLDKCKWVGAAWSDYHYIPIYIKDVYYGVRAGGHIRLDECDRFYAFNTRDELLEWMKEGSVI